MANIPYIKPERFFIKDNPDVNEKWVQNIIAEDPSILGLGDLIMKDIERAQPTGGRLDLLLQDPDSMTRYEVELQLGNTDESHIIRTLEYWDIERKRYPQYEHVAVLIAEDVTSRFLNVISLFNGIIPLVVIQINAFKIENKLSLLFTIVLDQMKLGLVDEDEEISEPADRAFWEKKTTEKTIKIVDDMFSDIIKKINEKLELKYNKHYIGLTSDGSPNNFVTFNPKKKFVKLEIRLPKETQIDEKIEEASLDDMGYYVRNGRYRIRITAKDYNDNKDLIFELFKQSFDFTNK